MAKDQSEQSIQRALYLETEAAKALRENLASLFEGDNQLAADMVEGETNLIEAIELAVKAIGEDKAAVNGLDEYIRELRSRSDRLKARIEMTRTAITHAFVQAGRQKIETAFGTASLKKVPPKLDITQEAEIPVQFFKRGDPKLDKEAVKHAINNGEKVPGATLAPEGQTVAIRFK